MTVKIFSRLLSGHQSQSLLQVIPVCYIFSCRIESKIREACNFLELHLELKISSLSNFQSLKIKGNKILPDLRGKLKWPILFAKVRNGGGPHAIIFIEGLASLFCCAKFPARIMRSLIGTKSADEVFVSIDWNLSSEDEVPKLLNNYFPIHNSIT